LNFSLDDEREREKGEEENNYLSTKYSVKERYRIHE
jgi:hypothetical protein